jgi:hypothetical protein
MIFDVQGYFRMRKIKAKANNSRFKIPVWLPLFFSNAQESVNLFLSDMLVIKETIKKLPVVSKVFHPVL